jgi:hypothetical protein
MVYAIGKIANSDNQEENRASVEFLKDALLQFKCERDEDLQSFLHNKAIPFDIKDKTRTYLILDDDEFYKHKNIVIHGYFSLAMKVLTVPDDLSNNQRKKLDGKYSNIENGISAFLIGQLGKSDLHKDKLNGRQMILAAMNIIKEAQDRVGGRVVYLECLNKPGLIRFYESNGFSVFRKNAESRYVIMVSYLNKFES